VAIKIKENISWVGKIDWELRKFHGEEYSTHRGSSYNSYLVKDEKTVLIDTAWGKFSNEFIAISYLIFNILETEIAAFAFSKL